MNGLKHTSLHAVKVATNILKAGLNRVLTSIRQVVISIISLMILFICFVNIMSASTAANNAVLASETLIETDILLISDEASIEAEAAKEIKKEGELEEVSIISNEAVLDEKFTAGINLSATAQVQFISIGNGTLITGMDLPEKKVLLQLANGKKCHAKTNIDGKFGCMFAENVVDEKSIMVDYE